MESENLCHTNTDNLLHFDFTIKRHKNIANNEIEKCVFIYTLLENYVNSVRSPCYFLFDMEFLVLLQAI